MNWAPVKMRWPDQTTQWMGDLAESQGLAGLELESTGERVAALASMATTSPGPVGAAAAQAVAAGRAALAGALGEAPLCLVVTPFQSGVGQGSGYQRYLSAPNLLQHMGAKLEDSSDDNRPGDQQYALVLMFLGTRYDQLATALSAFNRILPTADLQRAERRAQQLFDLESEKWELPTSGMLPIWDKLPLDRCTVTKVAGQVMSGQLAALEGYADSSPLGDLASMATRKASQAKAQAKRLDDLKAQFADSPADSTMQARFIGPGNAAELRKQLLAGSAPGHEWPLSAGVILVGSLPGLSFVRELVGL
jgi:hypothetical protein